MFFISAIALTFVHNWLRARSGSVWPAVFFHASHNIFFNHVYDPLMARYPLTDFFVTEFGAGLLVISVLMALYIWAHRDELPAATSLQIQTSPSASLVAK
jgi:protein-S-isoprenylcysteine O-methyltransferase Ste14